MINEQIFNEYIKKINTIHKGSTGFYIQNKNKFIVCVIKNYYSALKKRLINRNVVIIAEQSKIINKKTQEERNYLLIDCLENDKRKSTKAVFRRFNLNYRRPKVLNFNYKEWKTT